MNKVKLLLGAILFVGLFIGYFTIDFNTIEHPTVNMPHVYLTICVLSCAAFLFFSELFPVAVTATLIPCALSVFGIISVKEAWISFGDASILTIVALFMLGEAMFATGFAQRSASWVISRAGKSETMILVVSIAMIAFMSAFLNNAGITAITLPLIISIARKAHLSPSRLLLPTAYAASVGGMLSLVGTAPNMITNALLTQLAPEHGTFAFFEFAYFGLPFTIAVIAMYILFGRWLIPHKPNNPDIDNVIEEQIPYTNKMWVAGAVYVGVIVSMATGWLPITSAAMLGAMICIITKCMTPENAFKAVDWATIYIFAGALSLSYAMNKSGAAQITADTILSYVSDPYIIFIVACVIASILTELMSNTAVTAILVPLVVPLALNLGVSPLPFAMGIAVSVSSCFLTPIATPSNAMVMKPGGYSFSDYAKHGWPLQVVAWIFIIFLVPILWPL